MDASVIGKSSPRFRLVIEEGKVREFWRATSLTRPIEPMPAVDQVPPTFLVTQELWRDGDADPYAMTGFDVDRGLHAEQEFTFFGRGLRVGDHLDGVTTIEDIYTKAGRKGGAMTFMVAVTEFRDQNGELVAQARLTAVELSEAGS